MCYYFVCLGFISYLVLGTSAKDTVEVNRDLTVKPTPDPLTDSSHEVNVTLRCKGHRTELSFYIINKVQWTFIPSKGETIPLTDAFYPSLNASSLFNGPNARFSFWYGPSNESYAFYISITGVKRADDGIYRCVLFNNERKEILDSKDVRLTVVNPVENITIELYDAEQNFITKSTSPINQNARPFKIKHGTYLTKCMVTGSNPEPEMELLLNEQKHYIIVNAKEDNSTEFKTFVGAYEKNLTIEGHNKPQGLICRANVPGDFYASRAAGLVLMVSTGKPSLTCANASAAIGETVSRIKCNVSDENANDVITCENISWILGTTGHRIESRQKWSDPSGEFSILQSTCEKITEGLSVILIIFKVKPKVFDETFYFVYGHGESVHRHPVRVYEVMSKISTSSFPTTIGNSAVSTLSSTFHRALWSLSIALFTYRIIA